MIWALAIVLAITLSMVSERFAIAIAEIIVYALLLPISLFITVRHGISKSSGYLPLCIFCCLRLSTAGLGIASETNGHTNRAHLVWSEILGSVGLAPLLVAGVSLITRVNKNSIPRSNFRTNAPRILHILNVLALALTIVGGVLLSSYKASRQRSGKHFTQTGLSIFMAVFAIYTVLCVQTLLSLNAVASGERRILAGAVIAIPFLFLRILYAMLAAFRDKQKFSIINGSATVQLGMAVIMEMIVVVIYCGTGLFGPTEKQIARRKEDLRLQRAAI